MHRKWMLLCIVCVAVSSMAQEESTQPDKTSGKTSGIFGKKHPKVVLSPEEEAKRKAAIQAQIDALPKQGTPMLDESGKQMLDPDAKPMFNPQPKPLLDKKGEPGLDADGHLLLQTKDNLGYDEHGKKRKTEKVKEPKKVPVTIAQGTLTVDGWTGKARLNYDIADLRYIYIYAPGVGNTIISNTPFDGATLQKSAFDGKTLTISVADHTMQIAGEKPLLGKQKKALPAYVRVDREYVMNSRFPVMGYGTLRKPPYAWPGAKEVATTAPDLPKDITPVIARPVPVSIPTANPSDAKSVPAPKAPTPATGDSL